MQIEVDAPEPHQVLIVASDGTRWGAQVLDRAHIREDDFGPFAAALRYADAHLAVPAEPRSGEWAQDVSDGTPTLHAGTVIEAPASLAEAIEARRRS